MQGALLRAPFSPSRVTSRGHGSFGRHSVDHRSSTAMSTAAVAAITSASTDEELMLMSGTGELMVGVLFLGKRKERIYVSLGSQPHTV